MEKLWAPWRTGYILSGPKRGECLFCAKLAQQDDRKNYILERGKHSFALLNLYPYNNGHVMVAPVNHKGNLEDLDVEELISLAQMLCRWVVILKKAIHPQGFNIGMNLGLIAGAGVADHLHYHIVPRWSGDTNFMPVVAGTKVISQSLDECYEILVACIGKEPTYGAS